MIVGAARDDAVAARGQRGAHGARIRHHLALVLLEFGLQRLQQRHRLGRDHVHQRAALGTREHHRIELLGDDIVGARQDHAAARPAQCLVRGGRDHVGDRQRVGILPGSHQPGDVRHVDEQQRADLVGDGAKAREIQHARIGREARHDHLRLVFQRQRLDLLVVDQPAVRTHAVLNCMKQLAGEVHLGAVRQVTTLIQAHAEKHVTWRQQCEVHRRVGLRAGVRLHVDIVGAEKFLRPVDRQLLGNVHEFTAAVVALARIALRVFVGHRRTLRLQHPGTGVVLRGDEFDVILLALPLAVERALEFRVDILDEQTVGKHESTAFHG